MPNYTVRCARCQLTQEVFRKLKDHGHWPKHCGQFMFQVFTPPQIMSDIQPIRPPIIDKTTGKRADIRSRSQLREFERQNGCHQVGDDLNMRRLKPIENLPPVKEDLKRVVNEVLGRKKSRVRSR